MEPKVLYYIGYELLFDVLQQCRLQINPPNLPFTRGVRVDTDCVIYFTPRATGQQIATTNAHIFILTDLFLVCQHMEPEDKQLFGSDGPEMWLSYPPLAGKHLRVSDVQGAPDGVSTITLQFCHLSVIRTRTFGADPQERDAIYSL